MVVLVLMLLHYARYGDALEAILTDPLGWARWYPPFWFLAVYEQLQRGPAAPAFASELAPYAYRATLLSAALVLLTYPVAWARMQRVAIEGSAGKSRKPSLLWTRTLARLVPRPAERAVFDFIGHTLARNPRYQSYLALYGGVGLALAIGCATEIVRTPHGFRPVFSAAGLHAVLPLSLFWAVAGLHSAFAFPVNLAAGWIFRVSGARSSHCGAAARRWGLGLASAVTLLVTGVAASAGWTVWQLSVQLVCGVSLALLLTDAFFASDEHIPFNRPRMPGRTNFPLLLTLYVGILPLYVLGCARLEQTLEGSLPRTILLAAGTALIHFGLGKLRRESRVAEEELEGYDEEFQLLGLS